MEIKLSVSDLVLDCVVKVSLVAGLSLPHVVLDGVRCGT